MDFESSVQRWSSLALEQDWVAGWVEGAIFPCEMAFFLATCDSAGVKTVVESGRQDGYSTMILGEYAAATGVRVVSVDLEEDAPRAARCRERLARYSLDLVKGNAFEEVPKAVHAAQGPVGLVIDGPKGWPALAMAYACSALPKVAVVSLHNLVEGSDWRQQFSALANGSAFYEDHLTQGPPAWQELRRREQIALGHGVRSLEVSTLGVMVLDRTNRAAVAGASDRRFGFNQPALLRAGWSLGLFGPTRYLFSLSARLLRT